MLHCDESFSISVLLWIIYGCLCAAVHKSIVKLAFELCCSCLQEGIATINVLKQHEMSV